MKNLFFYLLSFFIFYPFAAASEMIGTSSMDIIHGDSVQEISFSEELGGGFYFDNYKVSSFEKKSGEDLMFMTDEAFSLNGFSQANSGNYTLFTSEILDNYIKMTWIANWTTTTNSFIYDGVIYNKDQVKSIGQLAIWYSAVSADITYSEYYFIVPHITETLFAAAGEEQDDFVANWLVAVGQSNNISNFAVGEQVFLINGVPMPEPSVAVLFGFGLLGLARFSRKK